MKLALTMPQFGESITEALIVRWLKKEGDEVREQEPLIELETEKSVFSYESPYKGTLLKILQAENQHVQVGNEIAHFEVADEAGKKYLSLGIGKELGRFQPVQKPVAPTAAPASPALSADPKGLSPFLRSLAKERGISPEELEKIKGTGPDGRLTQEDLLRHAGSTQKTDGVKVTPMSPIRARIAEKMSLSKREIPHAGTGVDVDVTAIDEWRKKQNSSSGHLPFVAVAVLQALKKFPVLNSSLKGSGSDLRIEEYSHVHLGLATATEKGLLVPVLRFADRMNFRQIVEEGNRLIEKARSGSLDVSELTGGTFTLNNTGALGAVRSQQIIPHPQSGILAMNRVTPRPWVVNNEIKVRSILSLDLAFDHRIVDGDAACGFLIEVKSRLEAFDFSII